MFHQLSNLAKNQLDIFSTINFNNETNVGQLLFVLDEMNTLYKSIDMYCKQLMDTRSNIQLRNSRILEEKTEEPDIYLRNESSVRTNESSIEKYTDMIAELSGHLNGIEFYNNVIISRLETIILRLPLDQQLQIISRINAIFS